MLANTSREAYNSIKPKLGTNQKRVLDTIKDFEPVTNDMIAKLLNWEINRVTGRVHELAEYGIIEQSGYGLTSSGRRAKAWVTKKQDDNNAKNKKGRIYEFEECPKKKVQNEKYQEGKGLE